jgi:hypothetical protein
MKKFPRKNQQGYIALIAVLIITAATLAISLSMNVISIGETQTGLIRQQSAQSFSLADACLQEALVRLKRDASFTDGGLKVNEGLCTITIIKDGSDRVITVAASVNTIIRQFESRITLTNGTIAVHYWKELL